MEYINEFVKYKEAKGEKAIYRVNDTRGYTYYSDDYVIWLEQQLRLFAVVGRSEQLFCRDCRYFEGTTYHDKMYCRDCRQRDRFTAK